MKKVILIFFSLIFSACGQQASTDHSQTKDVSDIQSMSRRPDGLYDVRCQDGRLEVRSANEIRSGNVCNNGGGGGGTGSLLCVARDNDGRDPWVLASLGSNGTVTKLAGTTYATMDQCRQATSWARPVDQGVIICITRDNDGRDPWVGAQINFNGNTIQKIPALSFNTLEQCTAGIGSARPFRNQLLLCTARDNDGRDPWILGRLVNGAMTKIPETVFTAIDQCQRSLDSARSTGDALWVCSSRDRDGRDPWNLYSITTSAVNRLDLSYGTFDQCVAGN